MSGAEPPSVSVIVVSRGRPDCLRLCLAGLSRLLYPTYEIVVVADPAGLEAVQASGLADEIKMVAFDEPNISRARNAGIAEASGEIVAFIDDDGVPEPAWLRHLARGFTWPETAAATGYVRGRNGISFQWRARSVDRTGASLPLAITGSRPVLLTPTSDRGIKTEGTNMAFRRSVLAEIGGFDPAFRYYLDETDLNMRLARTGQPTAIVPLAEVHHSYAGNDSRHMTRAPSDLFEIGASSAVFLARHCPRGDHAGVLERLRADRRRTLLGYMVDGRIEPRDVRKLMRRLDEGIEAGFDRPQEPLPAIPNPGHWFLPFETRSNGEHEVVAGRYIFRRSHRARAQEAAANGKVVSLFLLSRTTLAHRVRFRDSGVWEQRGGLWGRSDRAQKPVRFGGFRRRIAAETRRILDQRMDPSRD